MPVHPPAAEEELHNEKKHTYQEAGRNAQLIVHSQSPIIEQHRTDDALRDIISQAHFAIRNNLHQQAMQVGTVESKDYARYQHQHKCKLGQRGDDEQQWSEYCLISDEARQHVAQSVQREESDNCYAKHLIPHFQVFLQEQPASSYQEAEQEERRSLEHAPMIPGPCKAGKLAFPQIHTQGFEECAVALHFESCLP